MWELVSFMLGLGVFMLIMHYWMDPKQIIDDVKSLKGSNTRVDDLEKRVAVLEKLVHRNDEHTK